MSQKKIKSALVSVFHKEGLEPIVRGLNAAGVKLFSTGGTLDYISSLGISATSVEEVTGYPSILGGRVKTLHPKVFGGILNRADEAKDQGELQEFEIPDLDLVIVDLYPFEETVAAGKSEQEVIEKIDIGGISLIRAGAKNFKDIVIIASRDHYGRLIDIIEGGCVTDLSTRKSLARAAFDISSHYDSAIFEYFSEGEIARSLKLSEPVVRELRYGENPHQQGRYYGKLDDLLEQIHGKELSYNNLLDIDAAVGLIEEFEQSAFAIIKHTNACGLALSENTKEAYLNALAGDPISAFGGILVTNSTIDQDAAEEINKLFFEVLIAPGYEEGALELLKSKKNRIILIKKKSISSRTNVRSVLNGYLHQDNDLKREEESDLKVVTTRQPVEREVTALLLANKIVKHSKSNAIVLASENQLLASGAGQTSRVDALKQAIEKAKGFGMSLDGGVMASDAFFPFPDCVEIAYDAGIRAVVHPGGSKNDQASIDYCDEHGMAMAITGFRHFKH